MAARAELPIRSVKDESRFLTDLHLNSITVSQLVVEMAGRLGCDPPKALRRSQTSRSPRSRRRWRTRPRGREGQSRDVESSPQGVAPWFRVFAPILAERPRPRRRSAGRPMSGPWRVVALPDNPMASRLATDSHSRNSVGLASWCAYPLIPTSDTSAAAGGRAGRSRTTGRTVRPGPARRRRVVVRPAPSTSRVPRVTACVVDVPVDHPQSAEWIVAEAVAGIGIHGGPL